jgi:hypothetical protein
MTHRATKIIIIVVVIIFPAPPLPPPILTHPIPPSNNPSCHHHHHPSKRTRDATLPLHNPAHCIDLLSKDLAKSSVVCTVLAEAKDVFDFCWTNQIDNIRKEANDAGDIPASIVAQNVCETCMNLICIHLKSALAQSTFITSLSTNDSYKKYYGERSNARKQELDAILQNCNMDAGNVCWCSSILRRFFMMLTSYALVKMLH